MEFGGCRKKILFNIIFRREYIPVECVPTAAVAATRCHYQGGLHEADPPSRQTP